MTLNKSQSSEFLDLILYNQQKRKVEQYTNKKCYAFNEVFRFEDILPVLTGGKKWSEGKMGDCTFPEIVSNETCFKILDKPIDPDCTVAVSGKKFRGTFNVQLDPVLEEMLCSKVKELQQFQRSHQNLQKRKSIMSKFTEVLKNIVKDNCNCIPFNCCQDPKPKTVCRPLIRKRLVKRNCVHAKLRSKNRLKNERTQSENNSFGAFKKEKLHAYKAQVFPVETKEKLEQKCPKQSLEGVQTEPKEDKNADDGCHADSATEDESEESLASFIPERIKYEVTEVMTSKEITENHNRVENENNKDTRICELHGKTIVCTHHDTKTINDSIVSIDEVGEDSEFLEESMVSLEGISSTSFTSSESDYYELMSAYDFLNMVSKAPELLENNIHRAKRFETLCARLHLSKSSKESHKKEEETLIYEKIPDETYIAVSGLPDLKDTQTAVFTVGEETNNKCTCSKSKCLLKNAKTKEESPEISNNDRKEKCAKPPCKSVQYSNVVTVSNKNNASSTQEKEKLQEENLKDQDTEDGLLEAKSKKLKPEEPSENSELINKRDQNLAQLSQEISKEESPIKLRHCKCCQCFDSQSKLQGDAISDVGVTSGQADNEPPTEPESLRGSPQGQQNTNPINKPDSRQLENQELNDKPSKEVNEGLKSNKCMCHKKTEPEYCVVDKNKVCKNNIRNYDVEKTGTQSGFQETKNDNDLDNQTYANIAPNVIKELCQKYEKECKGDKANKPCHCVREEKTAIKENQNQPQEENNKSTGNGLIIREEDVFESSSKSLGNAKIAKGKNESISQTSSTAFVGLPSEALGKKEPDRARSLGNEPNQTRSLREEGPDLGKTPDRTRSLGKEDPDRTRSFGKEVPDRAKSLGMEPDRSKSLGYEDPYKTRTLGKEDPDRTKSLGKTPDRTRSLGKEDPDRTRSLGKEVPDQTKSLGMEPDRTNSLGKEPDRSKSLGYEDPYKARSLGKEVPDQTRSIGKEVPDRAKSLGMEPDRTKSLGYEDIDRTRSLRKTEIKEISEDSINNEYGGQKSTGPTSLSQHPLSISEDSKISTKDAATATDKDTLKSARKNISDVAKPSDKMVQTEPKPSKANEKCGPIPLKDDDEYKTILETIEKREKCRYVPPLDQERIKSKYSAKNEKPSTEKLKEKCKYVPPKNKKEECIKKLKSIETPRYVSTISKYSEEKDAKLSEIRKSKEKCKSVSKASRSINEQKKKSESAEPKKISQNEKNLVPPEVDNKHDLESIEEPTAIESNKSRLKSENIQNETKSESIREPDGTSSLLTSESVKESTNEKDTTSFKESGMREKSHSVPIDAKKEDPSSRVLTRRSEGAKKTLGSREDWKEPDAGTSSLLTSKSIKDSTNEKDTTSFKEPGMREKSHSVPIDKKEDLSSRFPPRRSEGVKKTLGSREDWKEGEERRTGIPRLKKTNTLFYKDKKSRKDGVASPAKNQIVNSTSTETKSSFQLNSRQSQINYLRLNILNKLKTTMMKKPIIFDSMDTESYISQYSDSSSEDEKRRRHWSRSSFMSVKDGGRKGKNEKSKIKDKLFNESATQTAIPVTELPKRTSRKHHREQSESDSYDSNGEEQRNGKRSLSFESYISISSSSSLRRWNDKERIATSRKYTEVNSQTSNHMADWSEKLNRISSISAIGEKFYHERSKSERALSERIEEEDNISSKKKSIAKYLKSRERPGKSKKIFANTANSENSAASSKSSFELVSKDRQYCFKKGNLLSLESVNKELLSVEGPKGRYREDYRLSRISEKAQQVHKERRKKLKEEITDGGKLSSDSKPKTYLSRKCSKSEPSLVRDSNTSLHVDEPPKVQKKTKIGNYSYETNVHPKRTILRESSGYQAPEGFNSYSPFKHDDYLNHLNNLLQNHRYVSDTSPPRYNPTPNKKYKKPEINFVREEPSSSGIQAISNTDFYSLVSKFNSKEMRLQGNRKFQDMLEEDSSVMGCQIYESLEDISKTNMRSEKSSSSYKNQALPHNSMNDRRKVQFYTVVKDAEKIASSSKLKKVSLVKLLKPYEEDEISEETENPSDGLYRALVEGSSNSSFWHSQGMDGNYIVLVQETEGGTTGKVQNLEEEVYEDKEYIEETPENKKEETASKEKTEKTDDQKPEEASIKSKPEETEHKENCCTCVELCPGVSLQSHLSKCVVCTQQFNHIANCNTSGHGCVQICCSHNPKTGADACVCCTNPKDNQDTTSGHSAKTNYQNAQGVIKVYVDPTSCYCCNACPGSSGIRRHQGDLRNVCCDETGDMSKYNCCCCGGNEVKVSEKETETPSKAEAAVDPEENTEVASTKTAKSQHTTGSKGSNQSGQNYNPENNNQNGQTYNQNGQTYNQNGLTYNQNGQTYNQNGLTYNQNGQPYNQNGQTYNLENNNQNQQIKILKNNEPSGSAKKTEGGNRCSCCKACPGNYNNFTDHQKEDTTSTNKSGKDPSVKSTPLDGTEDRRSNGRQSGSGINELDQGPMNQIQYHDQNEPMNQMQYHNQKEPMKQIQYHDHKDPMNNQYHDHKEPMNNQYPDQETSRTNKNNRNVNQCSCCPACPRRGEGNDNGPQFTVIVAGRPQQPNNEVSSRGSQHLSESHVNALMNQSRSSRVSQTSNRVDGEPNDARSLKEVQSGKGPRNGEEGERSQAQPLSGNSGGYPQNNQNSSKPYQMMPIEDAQRDMNENQRYQEPDPRQKLCSCCPSCPGKGEVRPENQEMSVVPVQEPERTSDASIKSMPSKVNKQSQADLSLSGGSPQSMSEEPIQDRRSSEQNPPNDPRQSSVSMRTFHSKEEFSGPTADQALEDVPKQDTQSTKSKPPSGEELRDKSMQYIPEPDNVTKTNKLCTCCDACPKEQKRGGDAREAGPMVLKEGRRSKRPPECSDPPFTYNEYVKGRKYCFSACYDMDPRCYDTPQTREQIRQRMLRDKSRSDQLGKDLINEPQRAPEDAVLVQTASLKLESPYRKERRSKSSSKDHELKTLIPSDKMPVVYRIPRRSKYMRMYDEGQLREAGCGCDPSTRHLHEVKVRRKSRHRRELPPGGYVEEITVYNQASHPPGRTSISKCFCKADRQTLNALLRGEDPQGAPCSCSKDKK